MREREGERLIGDIISQVSCQQFLGVMMFKNCRVIIGGHEVLALFPTNNYAQFIRMMLMYSEEQRKVDFYSLGKAHMCDYVWLCVIMCDYM